MPPAHPTASDRVRFFRPGCAFAASRQGSLLPRVDDIFSFAWAATGNVDRLQHLARTRAEQASGRDSRPAKLRPSTAWYARGHRDVRLGQAAQTFQRDTSSVITTWRACCGTNLGHTREFDLTCQSALIARLLTLWQEPVTLETVLIAIIPSWRIQGCTLVISSCAVCWLRRRRRRICPAHLPLSAPDRPRRPLRPRGTHPWRPRLSRRPNPALSIMRLPASSIPQPPPRPTLRRRWSRSTRARRG